MSSTGSPTFCVVPWIHVFGDERGLMRPCCKTLDAEARTIHHLDADGRAFTVHRPGDIEAGWQSELMRGMRRDMLDGRQPRICASCFGEEALAIRSYRNDINAMHPGLEEAAAAATAADGSAPLSLVRSLDVRLGNMCNLMCRMCSPVSSRLLIPEWRLLYQVENEEDNAKLTAMEHVNWFDRDDFWTNCEHLLPGMTHLHFAGGEPMIITRMLDFLERVIETGHAGHIYLSYVTNLTILPERVIKLWPAFKGVTLTGSLDGHGPINSYIRHPAKWDRIEDNLGRLIGTPALFNLDYLTINTTVQAYNILHLTDFFEYMLAQVGTNVRVYPRLSLLSWPACYSIQVLPPALKALAEARLRAFVQRWTGRWPVVDDDLDNFISSIDGVIAHMHAADRSHELPDFFARTRVLDGSRQQDLRSVAPEWSPFVDAGAAAPA